MTSNIQEIHIGEIEELTYDEDCLSKEFLESLLLSVYTRQISIEKAINIILEDLEYLKKNLVEG